MILLLLLGSGGRGQAQSYHYELGLSLLSNYYLGDLGRQGLFAPQSPGLALDLRRNISLRWALSGQLAYRRLRGSERYAATDLPPSITTKRFTRSLIDLTAGGEFHFFPYSDGERYLRTRSWTPYLGAGLSLGASTAGKHLQLIPSLYLSVGAKVRLSSRWSIYGSWSLRRTTTDALEGKAPPASQLSNPYQLSSATGWKSKDSYGTWSVGFSYSLSPRVLYPCK